MEKWMEKGLDAQLDLADIAYTSQTGRDPMKVRIAMIVRTAGEIREKLQQYIAGEDGIEDFYQGSVKGNTDAVAVFQGRRGSAGCDSMPGLPKESFARLLDFWVKGLPFDWNLLYEGKEKPKRIHLPTYPFAKDRYWPIEGTLQRHVCCNPNPGGWCCLWGTMR